MPDQSRRTFLKRAAQAGIAAMAGGTGLTRPAPGAETAAALPALTSHPSIGPIDPSIKSTVVHVQANEVLAGQRVHPDLAREMIEEGIRLVTGTRTPAQAWNALLGPEERIGIKFNHVGAGNLGTTVPLGIQLIESLRAAGFNPERIMLIEAPAELERAFDTRPPVFGWSGGAVDFGSGAEELAALLQEVDAIINVPFLKTHNIAGMSGCLKNLSHALIRRPGRYHGDACSAAADIVALAQIRSKLRIHIVNGLRGMFDKGPDAGPEGIWPHAGLLVSRDPVAADSVAADFINEQRQRAGLLPIGDAGGRIPHLAAAVRRGLGTDDQDYIQRIEPRMA
jgi:hypothetical protein